MDPILTMENVGVEREGNRILDSISLQVQPGQRWVVIGPNGGGKSTLLAVASLDLHPSSGCVRLLGIELGRADIRPLRGQVGIASALLANRLRGALTCEEVVHCGRYGALEPWWHRYTEADHERARNLLAIVGLGAIGPSGRTMATLSSGELQRVLLARALFNDPALLLLDEPNAGLDPGAREALIEVQDELAARNPQRATMLVTHHVEDIPRSATHLVALSTGRVVAAGPIESTLTAELINELFGVNYKLYRPNANSAAPGDRSGQRWFAGPAV